jgi:hypothetical protein
MTKAKKTNKDLLFAMLRMTGGEHMVESFKQECLPLIGWSPSAHQELTEEEYQEALVKIRGELPYFLNWLLSRDS